MAREPTSVSPLFEQRMRINSSRTVSPTPNTRPTTPTTNNHNNHNTASKSALLESSQATGSDRPSSTEAQPSSASALPANSAVLTLNPNSMAMVVNGVSKPAKNGAIPWNIPNRQAQADHGIGIGLCYRRKAVPECSDIRVSPPSRA
jgi:hypothetical protein